jgi:hypothetical protein
MRKKKPNPALHTEHKVKQSQKLGQKCPLEIKFSLIGCVAAKKLPDVSMELRSAKLTLSTHASCLQFSCGKPSAGVVISSSTFLPQRLLSTCLHTIQTLKQEFSVRVSSRLSQTGTPWMPIACQTSAKEPSRIGVFMVEDEDANLTMSDAESFVFPPGFQHVVDCDDEGKPACITWQPWTPNYQHFKGMGHGLNCQP